MTSRRLATLLARAHMTPDEWQTWKVTNAKQPNAIAAYPALERQDFDPTLDQTAAAAPPQPMPLVVLTASEKFADLVPQAIDQGLLPPSASVPRDFGVVIDRANIRSIRQVVDAVRAGETWLTGK